MPKSSITSWMPMRFRFRSVRSVEDVPLVVMAPSVISSCKLAGSISLPSRTCATSLGWKNSLVERFTLIVKGGRVALLPRPHLVTGFSKHPLADLQDQARILGDRKKLLGQ